MQINASAKFFQQQLENWSENICKNLTPKNKINKNI